MYYYILAAVGGGLLLINIITCICCSCRRNKKRDTNMSSESRRVPYAMTEPPVPQRQTPQDKPSDGYLHPPPGNRMTLYPKSAPRDEGYLQPTGDVGDGNVMPDTKETKNLGYDNNI